MHILVAVTHLLGTGHLRRTINLSQAFIAAGHAVTLVSGGMPVAAFDTRGLNLVQLPPLRSDGTNFTRLLTADGTPADTHYLQSRCDKLTETLQVVQPSVVITELFPFGRRVLREEFLELLRCAHLLPRKPVILSSIRDILAAPSSNEKVLKTHSLIDGFYDGVAVHSVRESTPLDASWPVSEALQEKLFYTGYVAQRIDPAGTVSGGMKEDIIVSAGGGSVGTHIYETAIDAARLLSSRRWRILVGGSAATREVARLKSMAAGTATVIESNRPDFRSLLQNARCSVSMCGYNTAVDLLSTGTPGVLIPFDTDGEREQTVRATSLSAKSHFSLLPAKQLTASSLCDAVERVTAAGRFEVDAKRFNGAVETVRFATTLAECKR